MKPALMAFVIAALFATARADEQSDDYKHFELWLQGVYHIAPSHGLELNPGAEDEEEFFYLYCWQSDDHSPENCVRQAKQVWGK